MRSVGGERMLRGDARGEHALRGRIALHRAGDGFLRGLIVEVLDLLVVVGVPMDEDADADEEIVGLGSAE